MYSLNDAFCYDVFFPRFMYKPYLFYNQFYNEENTRYLIDSMGEHPGIEEIVFRYSEEKKLRASFICFKDAELDCDVKCICTLYQGEPTHFYCYFFELCDDGSIACSQVAGGGIFERVSIGYYLEDNIDSFFGFLCSRFEKPHNESKAMLVYLERDKCVRLIDIDPAELTKMFGRLIGGEPECSCKEYNGATFIVYKSAKDSSCIIARTIDGKKTGDATLADFDYFKRQYED